LLTLSIFLITIAPDMKTQLATSPIFTQGIESSQVSNMDMDLEGMKQACQIFRDNIYTDKILAVVREWVSNAVDEHLKHGIEQSVQTGVKEGRFFVRDFANGLDDNGIRNVFGKYFRSTKSNSDQPIGGFGVGAKAGHCYQDTFYVTSFYNGTKTVYSCVLGGDESGASIGQVIEMSQEPTNESGLLVEIDIKAERGNNGDTSTFVVYAQAMADYATLANIEVIDDSGNIVDGIYENNKKTLILEKDGIRFYSFESGLISDPRLFAITMGGVKYHTPDSFKGFGFEDQCSPATAIQIDVPVGFFEVPISREFFRETAKFTNGIAKCEAILGEFINQQKESLGELTLSDLCVNKLNKTSDFKFKNNAFVPSKVALSLAKIGSLNPNNTLAEHNGRKLVLLLSDSYHHRGEQVRKIEDWCKTNNKSVLYCTKHGMEYVCSAISQYSTPSDLVFRAASTIYPKNTQGSGISDNRYTVNRRGYGSKSFRWSALELHNEYWSVDHTEQEAQQFLAQIPQSNKLDLVQKILILDNGFHSTYSFKSVLLKRDLIALGYASYDDPAIVATIKQLQKSKTERDQARSEMSQRYHKCKNLLSSKSQQTFSNRISKDPFSPILEKRVCALEKITEELKNNKNELVATFTKLTLESYYFQASRSDVRKFIKAAK